MPSFDSGASRTEFRCVHCGAAVALRAAGTRHRNHCPHCLFSLHVDRADGDRANACRGAMEPVAIAARGNDGEWSIVHRCTQCGDVRLTRSAGDDNAAVLVALAVRPLAHPPFPLDRLGRGL